MSRIAVLMTDMFEDVEYEKPADAFIAVPYRNYWFWIDDRDMRSKTLFSFLMFVFSLTETGGVKEGAPIITVPTG